jgi:hypothetical protein
VSGLQVSVRLQERPYAIERRLPCSRDIAEWDRGPDRQKLPRDIDDDIMFHWPNPTMASTTNDKIPASATTSSRMRGGFLPIGERGISDPPSATDIKTDSPLGLVRVHRNDMPFDRVMTRPQRR